MSFQHKDGYGAIFKDAKKNSEGQPDYRGSLMVGGVVYQLAGWVKTGAKGPFLSLKAQPDGEKSEKPRPQRQPDDSIPF